VSRDVLKVADGDHEGLSLLESSCRAVVCPIEAGANRPEEWGSDVRQAVRSIREQSVTRSA